MRRRLFLRRGATVSRAFVRHSLECMTLNVHEQSVNKAPRPAPESATNRPSVVVLPFDNLSGEADKEYFVAGITEDTVSGFLPS
jgi:hypothetical protein